MKWGAITRHVALLRNCKDSTCRLCPTLIPFFFSLSPVSPFLSPTDTHPSRSLFLFTRHFPTTPPPVLTNTRTQHAVENNVSESHVLAATGSITRLSRLPVGFLDHKISFSRGLSFSASLDAYLSHATFEIACAFYRHTCSYIILSFSFHCILLSWLLYYL